MQLPAEVRSFLWSWKSITNLHSIICHLSRLPLTVCLYLLMSFSPSICCWCTQHGSLTVTIWIWSSYRSASVRHVSLLSLVTLATCIIIISFSCFFFFNLPFYLLRCLTLSWNDLRYCHWSCNKHLVFLSVCLSVPQSPQDTQPTSVLPDDSSSVLMDDTSSQWSAAADSEEERRSALEKSMYVFKQCKAHGIMMLSQPVHVI